MGMVQPTTRSAEAEATQAVEAGVEAEVEAVQVAGSVAVELVAVADVVSPPPPLGCRPLNGCIEHKM